MNVKKLVQGLSYVGEAEGKRQRYYVFRGGDDFLALSFSKTKPQAGNFNIVGSEAVDYVRSRLKRRKAVTAKDVWAIAKRSRHVPTSLAALNILYVLVALGEAKADARRVGPKLYFNLSGGRS
ncbi:MAG TPA: hypothetical protein VI007_03190 [bacterium]